jgi:YjbE family integral membrane protein
VPDTAALVALLQVVLIDVVLSGDNAVVIGMATAGLPPAQRRRALAAGILAATLLRIVFALAAASLLRVLGLTLAGGVLLLWVAWRLWRELGEGTAEAGSPHAGRRKTMGAAMAQIVLADVSMSLDNVLAVAGAAMEHPAVLAAGLVLSIALMGVAAAAMARLLERVRWVAYAGLGVIVWVALGMVWRGGGEVYAAVLG